MKWLRTPVEIPKDGWYLFTDKPPEIETILCLGEGSSSGEAYSYIAGPIPEPDPLEVELDLPDGWQKVADDWLGYSRWVISVSNFTTYIHADRPTRSECIEAINRAVQALEGK